MKRGLVIASLLIVAGVAMYVVGNVALSRTSRFRRSCSNPEEEQQAGGFAADRVTRSPSTANATWATSRPSRHRPRASSLAA